MRSCYSHLERLTGQLAASFLWPADSLPTAPRYREEVLSRTRGGSVNRRSVAQQRTTDIPVPDLIHQLRAQRPRISELTKASGTLQNHRTHLLPEPKALAS